MGVASGAVLLRPYQFELTDPDSCNRREALHGFGTALGGGLRAVGLACGDGFVVISNEHPAPPSLIIYVEERHWHALLVRLGLVGVVEGLSALEPS
jgi:hypothetical protein